MSATGQPTPDPKAGLEVEGIDEHDPKVVQIRQADLVISPLLIVLSVYFAIESYQLSAKAIAAGQANWSTSPGLFPLITCVLIAACSLHVLRHALRTAPPLTFLSWQSVQRHYTKFEPWITIIVLGLFSFYIFVLLGRVPFEFATGVYILSMLVIFRAARLLVAIPIATFYTLGLSYAFTEWAATIFPKSIFN